MKKLMMLLLLSGVSIQVVAHDRDEAAGQPAAQRRRTSNAPGEGVSESKGDDVDMPGGQQAVRAPQRRRASRNIFTQLHARSVAGKFTSKAVPEALIRTRRVEFADTYGISDLLDSDGKLDFGLLTADANWVRVKAILDDEEEGFYFSSLVKAIDFSRCRSAVEEFSRYAAGFTSLEELGLGNCGLPVIPAWVGDISGLKKLSLWGNRKITISPGFEFPATLEELDLSSCSLSDIPAWVDDIPGLKKLYLDWNCWIRISDGFEFPKTLEELSLISCGLPKIPKGITKIPGLKKLDLSGSWGIIIAPGFEFPATLEELDLTECGLTRIPAGALNRRVQVLI